MVFIKKHSFILILTLLLLILFIISTIHLNGIYKNFQLQTQYNLKSSVDLKYEVLQKELKEIKDDILYLADLYRDLNQKIDKKNFPLIQSIYNFSSRHSLYGQIRFLNLKGKELLRVDNKNGSVIIIPENKLQDKSNRYYFKNATSLKENEMYLSPFDLNIENKQIETPFNPTLRLVLPIFKDGEKIAYTIINYSGKMLLDRVNKIDRKNIKTILINQDGFYLISNNKKKEWSFMFDKKYNLKIDNKKLWNNLKDTHNNSFNDIENIYSFRSISPKDIINLDKNSFQKWSIISYIEKEYLTNKFINYLKTYLFVILFITILIVFFSYLISRYIDKIDQYEKEVKLSDKKFAELKRIHSLDDMILNISHQWRQPLSVIGLCSNNLQMCIELGEKISIDELKSSLKDIDDQTLLLTDTINQLSKDFTLKKEEFTNLNLKDIIEITLQNIQEDFEKNKIKTILNVEEISFQGKKEQLLNALSNILNNSKDVLIKNNEENRYIFISTEIKDKNTLTLIIRDTGGGISPKIIDNIFEPYFTTKHKAQGVGISLYLTYQIIVFAHNGYIFAQNSISKISNKEFEGLEFKIQLPLKQ